jgi:hypothetical protein
LAHIKHVMVDFIFKPAGVPPEVYQPLLCQRDEATGRPLTKRQLAPLVLDAVEKRPDCQGVLRNLIEITANWNSFHLADDEFAARAAVQKAREVLGTVEMMEAREAKQRELARKEELRRMERERTESFRKQSDLLLMMFDEIAKSDDSQRRGYLLQDLLNRLFDLHQIPLVRPFTRNEGAEQIDGAFKLEGWHYLVECRWRQKLADIRELDGLKGQVDRSGKQTMGFFLSVNGWSHNVPRLLRQNPEKSIILMEGYDLRTVLSGSVDLRHFVLAKVAKLNLEAEPFLGVQQYAAEQRAQ